MKAFTAAARVLTTGALICLAGTAAAQQAYPNKPIRFIVPYPPGGSTNTVARLVGQKLSENWGQQVIVDNRPGGNTIIGSEALVKSPADGYTIMLHGSTIVTIPHLLTTPFDAIKDFAPVATVNSTELMLVLHPSVPANNLRQFIALAKARPGQLNYASAGNGTPNHLAAALFEILTGVKLQHIPYKGGGPALIDLLGGQVQLYFNVAIGFIPHVQTGKLKPIAISGDARLPALPGVPTFAEAGLPGYAMKGWYGVLAPAGTPKEIVSKLSTEIGKILATPDIKEKLTSQGLEPFISTPEQFAALMKADLAKYGRIIKTANIKMEN